MVFATLLLAMASFMAFTAWQQGADSRVQMRAQVESSARLIGEKYAMLRTQHAQNVSRLLADDALVQSMRRGQAEKVRERLDVLSGLNDGEFVAVFDDNFGLVAHLSNAIDASAVGSQLKQLGIDSGAALVETSGISVALQAARLEAQRRTFTLVSGYRPDTVLPARLTKLFDNNVVVSVPKVGAKIAPTDQQILLPLDSFSSVEDAKPSLNVLLDVSNNPLVANNRSLLLKLFGQSLAILMLGTLATTLLFGRLLKSRIERPLLALRRAIRSLKDGNFEEPVAIVDVAPFSNLSHDLEGLREAISDRENRILHHAEYDALTGLTNRSVITEKLNESLAKAKRNGSVITALAIDLSRFSEINGSMGHEAGDLVLKEIARRLASNARVTDTVARVGGDEFFVILEDTEVKLALHLAKFMVSSLTTPIQLDGNEIKLNIRAGAAFFPQHCDNAEALRRMANIALYTAKEKDSTMVVYEAGQDEKHLRELAIIHDLPNAIKNNELYLQYQPKIDMETQQVRQVEALVRWRHPQLGFIPPDEFIALLEKAGMIGRLTDWVFKEAIRQSRAWMDAGYEIGVAVNISAHDLDEEKLADRLKLLLHHYLVDASKITIEVTESAVIKDPENSVKVLNELRKAGVRCSLDDFGTGQTSLALLKQLPISELKIDKSFVQNLRADSGDAIIVKSIIDLGHNMGLQVTAEGVESNYCWNLLNSYGCNLVQGYLVSAPLTADELGEWHLRLQDRHVNKLDLSFVQDMSA